MQFLRTDLAPRGPKRIPLATNVLGLNRGHMKLTDILLGTSAVVIALVFSLPGAAANTPAVVAGLWQDRGDITSLNLLDGPGGKEHRPAGKFTFVKEDKQGGSPKFEIVDEQGVRWKAKLGTEAQSETVATRLVWAAGYFTDEDYYLPELRVEKMPKLSRGREFISDDGVVRGVRLERSV
jgi:hypothetical protein